MGQYHGIYNKTKKEYFSFGGAKLWEKTNEATAAALLLLLSNSNGRGGGDFMVWAKKSDPKTYKSIYSKKELALKSAIDAVSGRWAGDEIVVQGDYAKKGDAAYIDFEKEDKSYKSINDLVLRALLAIDPDCESNVSAIVKREIEWQEKLKKMRGAR